VVLARSDDGAGEAAAALAAELQGTGLRVELDARTDTSFGRRVVDWELKGVPLRVEVGPRDLAQGEVVLARRDTGTKTSVPLAGVAVAAAEALDAIHDALFSEAADLRQAHTVEAATLEEAQSAAGSGFAVVPLSVLGTDGETTLNRAGISIRCIQTADGGLSGPEDGAAAGAPLTAVVGRAY